MNHAYINMLLWTTRQTLGKDERGHFFIAGEVVQRENVGNNLWRHGVRETAALSVSFTVSNN